MIKDDSSVTQYDPGVIKGDSRDDPGVIQDDFRDDPGLTLDYPRVTRD